MSRFVAVALALLVAPLGSALATTLDYVGYAFETGGFPPSAPGDELRIPVTVDRAAEELGIQFASEELTGWISGLVSNGPQPGDDGVTVITYSAGRIEFFRDPSRDHDYGVDPPNATVPSTFTNGELCLGGEISDFVVFFDASTNSGAYQGNVVFDTGSCLETLHAIRAEGFTFGGILTPAAATVPTGYSMQVDGFLAAQKQSIGCEIHCFGIETARFDFPRTPKHVFKPTDGKFRIKGEFVGCPDTPRIDPTQIEIRVQIGDYVQVLPAGSLHPGEVDDCDDDEDGPCWFFSNPSGTGTLTRFEMQFDIPEGEWDFEAHGRGIPRSELIGASNLLSLDIDFGGQEGSADETLVQKRNHMRFVRHGDTCGPGSANPAPGIVQRAPDETAVASDRLRVVRATPNPMRDTTVFLFRAPRADTGRIAIFDVRGHRVRSLVVRTIAAGESQVTWDGRDASGTRVAAGIYIYRLDGAPHGETSKIVVAR